MAAAARALASCARGSLVAALAGARSHGSPTFVAGGARGLATAAAPAASLLSDKSSAWREPANLTPQQVVEALSSHIIGQEEAKRAIAIALRNRWRRMRLPASLQDEVIPKNILMVGPTGCGKTEIARRLAKLCRAPFVKVEATKFTEVGYHGRDVDTIIKDLMDASLTLVKELRAEAANAEVGPLVEARLLEALTGPGAAEETVESFRSLLREGALEEREVVVDVPVKEAAPKEGKGGLPGMPDVEVSVAGMGGPGATIDIGELMSRLSGGAGGGGGASGRRGSTATVRRTLKVKDARAALEEGEVEKKLASLDLRKEAVTLAEQNGIVFIDEIDKLISNRSKHSGDASSEGVQRDLLPLIEGTTIEVRRFGNVRTDYMLFVASGAFHEHKPSELLAELQGRLPIRVELKALDARDLERILTETRFNLLEQQSALLRSEGIELVWEPDAVKEVAKLAADINRAVENIGARRLHTVIERVVEDVSFGAAELVREAGGNEANERAAGSGADGPTPGELPSSATLPAGSGEGAAPGGSSSGSGSGAAAGGGGSAGRSPSPSPVKVVVDVALVRKKLLPMLQRSDFSKFIL